MGPTALQRSCWVAEYGLTMCQSQTSKSLSVRAYPVHLFLTRNGGPVYLCAVYPFCSNCFQGSSHGFTCMCSVEFILEADRSFTVSCKVDRVYCTESPAIVFTYLSDSATRNAYLF